MYKRLLIFFLIIGCQEFNIPKQKGYLAHKFDIPNYKFFSNDCYKFNVNSSSEINVYSLQRYNLHLKGCQLDQ